MFLLVWRFKSQKTLKRDWRCSSSTFDMLLWILSSLSTWHVLVKVSGCILGNITMA